MRVNSLCFYTAALVACGSLPFAARAAETTSSGASAASSAQAPAPGPEAGTNGIGASPSPTLEESPAHPPYRPLTLGLELGTTGVGASLSWRFADHFGLRAGVDYLEFSDSGLAIKDLTYDASVRLLSEPLTFDIYPWKRHSFRISVGVQFNENLLTGTAHDEGTLIPPERLGALNLRIEQQLVNPYLSIGGNFFYFDHAHHWALGGELGVAYTGEPSVSLTRSGPSAPLIDAAIRREEGRIQDYANQFKWWPVLKLGVTYSF